MHPPRDPLLPGQESVWDYPRPPVAVPSTRRVTVVLGGVTIADTRAAVRVLETSHPPTWYLPRAAFLDGALRAAAGSSVCEWKGRAGYFDLLGGGQVAARAAWSYPAPAPPFAALRDHLALYAAAVDACYVDGERVTPQPGAFYGGWITADVAGPFKGGPGSMGW